MPVFEIEQYEIHTQKYRVKAKSKADAVVKVLNGEADALDNEQEYIEVADDLGLPVIEHRALTDQIRKLGGVIGDTVISSIRSIEQVE